MELSLFLYSFLLPTLFGSGLIALCWFLPPLRRRDLLQSAVFGVALGAGVIGSFYAESGLPDFPPRRSDAWIGWLGLISMVAAPLAVLVLRDKVLRLEFWGMIIGTFVACLPLLAWASSSSSGPKSLFPDMSGANHVMLAITIAFATMIMVRLQEVRGGAVLPCLLALAFTTGSLTALAAGWITMGIIFGVISAISGSAALIGRFSGVVRIGTGGAVASVLLLVVLPVASWCKTSPPEDLHWWYWAMIPGSLLLLVPCENRWFDRLPALAAFWIRVAVVASPLVFVLIRIIPMLLGDGSDGTDEFEEMMKLYE